MAWMRRQPISHLVHRCCSRPTAPGFAHPIYIRDVECSGGFVEVWLGEPLRDVDVDHSGGGYVDRALPTWGCAPTPRGSPGRVVGHESVEGVGHVLAADALVVALHHVRSTPH